MKGSQVICTYRVKKFARQTYRNVNIKCEKNNSEKKRNIIQVQGNERKSLQLIYPPPHPKAYPFSPPLSSSPACSTSAFWSLAFADIFHPDVGGASISTSSFPPSRTSSFPPFPVSNPSSISEESTLGRLFDFLLGEATSTPTPTPLTFDDEDGLDDINIDGPIIVVVIPFPIGIPVPVPPDGRSRFQDTPSPPSPTSTPKLAGSGEDICIEIFGGGRGGGGGGYSIISQARMRHSDLPINTKVRKREMRNDSGRKKTYRFLVFYLVWEHVQANQYRPEHRPSMLPRISFQKRNE
jgi:hypothetical protein